MSSWWHSLSLETLTSLNTYAQWAMVLFAVLTALAMAANIKSSARISAVKDAQLSALEQKQTTTKEEVAVVQKQQQPRELNARQQASFLEILTAEPRGTIFLLGAAIGDGEALAFATELRQLLQSAGWGIENFATNWTSTFNPVGVLLIVHSREKAPAYAGTLQRAFKAVNIAARQMIGPRMQEGSLKVIVGHKAN